MQKPKSPQTVNPSRKLAFDLRLLFYITSLFATGLAISPGTIVTTSVILLFWFLCFSSLRSTAPGRRLLAIAIGFIFVTWCAGNTLFATSSFQAAFRRAMCMNNMKQLGLAILNYEAARQNFPEAKKIVQGNPHSWRVTILPEIEQQTLFEMYDYSQPWNSPGNRKIAQIQVGCMTCPSSNATSKTPYKLVTGPGTLFEDGKLPTFDQITDGTSNTIIMIEDNGNPVDWTDPDGDVSIDEAVKILSQQSISTSVHHSNGQYKTTYFGTHVFLADGSVQRIGFNADPEVLRRAFLCADGELTDDLTKLGHPITVIRYGAIIATVIYVLLAIAPIVPFIRERRRQQLATNSRWTKNHE